MQLLICVCDVCRNTFGVRSTRQGPDPDWQLEEVGETVVNSRRIDLCTRCAETPFRQVVDGTAKWTDDQIEAVRDRLRLVLTH